MSTFMVDAAFLILLATVVPALGVRQFRRHAARVAEGDRGARPRLYRRLIVQQVLLATAAVALWLAGGRGIGELGPGTAGTGLWAWAGWIGAVLLAVFMAVQAILMGRDARGQDLATARKQLDELADFLPHDGDEARGFGALSIAAAIGEELVYRGFALAWLLALFAGPVGLGSTPALWLAVAGSSVLFGLAHAYQGVGGVIRTTLAGVFFALLAVATGWLIAPMIAHAALDLSTGVVARKAMGDLRPRRSRASTA